VTGLTIIAVDWAKDKPKRAVDRRLKDQPISLTGGIPGTVGSGTRGKARSHSHQW